MYQQFMRLTQFYEEDELRTRQEELRAYAARVGDERLGNGFVPPRPSGPITPPITPRSGPEPRRRSRSRASNFVPPVPKTPPGPMPKTPLGPAPMTPAGPMPKTPTNIALGNDDPETETEEGSV